MKIKFEKQKVLIFVSLFLLGFVAMCLVQMRNYDNPKRKLEEEVHALKEQIETNVAREEREQQKRRELEAKRLGLLDAFAKTDDDKEVLVNLKQARLQGGLTEVKGEGLVVTLNDKADYNEKKDSILSVVHDRYLRTLLESLINGGAAAVSVNGVRIIKDTTVTCVGPVIMVGKNRLAPPYVVRAVGPFEAMYNEVLTEPLLAQITSPEIGIQLHVVKENVLVPPYSGALIARPN